MFSLRVMIIGAVGIELASASYRHHNNLHFGLYCNAVGGAFLLFIAFTFISGNSKELEVDNIKDF